MEKEEKKITPQDIIDKEFRVKFRGFDMAEVDIFLEEVAENFFKLNEENILLHEKILALQQDLETRGALAPQGPIEFPAELGNLLEELKHDSATISAELGALKQDRQTFDALRDKLEKVMAGLDESRTEMTSQPQAEFPADLAETLAEFKRNAEAIAAELAALQEERQALASLKINLEEIIASAREAVPIAPGPGSAAIPGGLDKTLESIIQGTENLGAELTALKQEVSAITGGVRSEVNNELQELLAMRFDALEAKLSGGSGLTEHAAQEPAAAPAPEKKEKLAAALIEEEKFEEDTRLTDNEEQDEGPDDSNLEFLSEDDILDVDKLRGIFQSVLDEGLSEGHASREGDEASADLLFLEEDFIIDDEHEPEVTFALDENETENKVKSEKS